MALTRGSRNDRGIEAFIGEILAEAQEQAVEQVRFGLLEAMVQAAEMAGDTADEQIKRFVKGIREDLLPPEERLAIHRRVAESGKRAVMASYRSSRAASGLPAGYRPDERYSGGVLAGALASSDFYEVTPNGIKFINFHRLNQEAAQWARLNFGAGAAGGGSLPDVQVTFDGQPMGSIGLDEPARPAFRMPRGYFVGGAFHPGPVPSDVNPDRVIRDTIWSKGIRGRNFLDAGVAAIAGGPMRSGGASRRSERSLGNEYTAAIENTLERAGQNLGQQRRSFQVDVNRSRRSPRMPGWRFR